MLRAKGAAGEEGRNETVDVDVDQGEAAAVVRTSCDLLEVGEERG